MSFFEAILLGLVQGLTEFFPISSSGHLIILEQLLGVESDYGVFLNVLLHIGTLLAVMRAFHKEVKRLVYSFVGIVHDLLRNLQICYLKYVKKQDLKYKHLLHTSNRKMLIFVLLACIPTAILGQMLYGFVSSEAITLFIVGFALLITGLLLFVVELAVSSMETNSALSWKKAIVIGICQGFSVIPGISRFGTTLSVGMFCGLSKSLSIKYSFLLSIPTMIGAILFELFQIPSSGMDLTFGFVVFSILGAAVAFIAGSFAIKFLLWVVKNSKLRYFAVYCFVIGVISIVLNYMM